ncbi:MAG: hypothetical protein HY321_18950 [Armatimonadetes bacterium]|nr:hypothetical protein [Armatimonadota bacterium]
MGNRTHWHPPRVGVLKPRPWLTSQLVDGDVEERVARAIEFQEGDRVPVWDVVDNRAIYDHLAPEAPDFLTASVKVYHALGIDLVRATLNPPSPGRDGEFVRGGAGADADHVIQSGTSWRVNRRIQSIEDLRRFEPPPLPTREEIWENDIASMRRRCEAFAPRSIHLQSIGVGFMTVMTGLLGLELASYAIYDAPEEVHRLLDAYTARSVLLAEALAEARLSPLVFVGEDVAYKGALMYSPAFLRKELIPRVRRVAEPLRRAGIKVIFHSDGNIMGILDDLIEAGIDGLNPIEPPAGMDIGYLKRRYHGKLILVGNVDCTRIALGTPAGAVAMVKENLRVASPGGGHLIGSSTEVLPSTPVENILAYYRAIHEYGRYPISV